MEEATHGKASEEVIIVCACCTVSSTIIFQQLSTSLSQVESLSEQVTVLQEQSCVTE